MNIFNALNLRGNKLSNAVIDTNGSATAGGIRYNSTDNLLEYYNGTEWVTVGGGESTTISGKFAIFTGTWNDSSNTGALVPVTDDTPGSLTNNRLKVTGDGSGNISFMSNFVGSGGTQTVTTNITHVAAATVNLNSSSPGNTPADGYISNRGDDNGNVPAFVYAFNHGLGSVYVIVQVYYSSISVNGSSYTPFSQILCDIDVLDPDNIRVSLSNPPTGGYLRIVVYSASSNVAGGSITPTNHVVENTASLEYYSGANDTQINDAIDSDGLFTSSDTSILGAVATATAKNNS